MVVEGLAAVETMEAAGVALMVVGRMERVAMVAMMVVGGEKVARQEWVMVEVEMADGTKLMRISRCARPVDQLGEQRSWDNTKQPSSQLLSEIHS